ncbi:MAG: nucleotidyltransferase domain-containing protein [Lachnospiraceae bacterium]|nr:nucleotidyltransferase domain-containing protein [Lachnospiraceae bacterium]
MEEKIYTIEEIKEKIDPIAVKYHLHAVFIFGSYATGTATSASDIDFIVDTTGSKINSLLELGGLYSELEETFCKRIDMITLRSLEQPTTMQSDIEFRTRVTKERINLYEAA